MTSLRVLLTITVNVCSCSAQRLPPGTPPPEYESSALTLLPMAADAGSDAAEAGAADPSPRSPALSPAAGVR